jgi:hypothetical protein
LSYKLKALFHQYMLGEKDEQKISLDFDAKTYSMGEQFTGT